ncbi:putative F-box domain-containing protein [Seiridium cardinale]|uniref:F-box domain-containing protein n=1 Tax=Seiridium cardinale TaxID=138064 RepID=A0ABR2XY73_9PEZI
MASQFVRPFELLPAELILEMMKNMGVSELTAFALSNKKLCGIFQENRASIMTAVLLRTVELDPMLLLYTIDKRDFSADAMLHPRRISVDVGRGPDKHIEFIQSAVAFRDGKLICPRKIILGIQDLDRLWNMMKIVDWWVEVYPRLRWHKTPEDTRCLRPSEEHRLRKAIARWWLYSECFHGKYARSPFLPRILETDDRLYHLRLMSSIEIRELEDLWETLRGAVQRDVCSSISCKDWDRVPWGWDDWRTKDIVSTYMKLDPAQLKYLIQESPRLGKPIIINAARQSQPDFSEQQETLYSAIQTVLQERLLLMSNAFTDIPSSGIVDEDCFYDEKDIFTADAWPTGKPPLSRQEIMSYPTRPPKYVPYGDDGRDLDFQF